MPKTTSHDGLNIDYDVQGSGPALLLIAGLSADRGLWGYTRDTLNSSFTTIAFDNRDAGQSDLAQSKYGYADLAKDALSVLDAAGFEKVHVLGHSMGGVIAQELAIMQPDRVLSLIIANSYAQNDVHTTEHVKLASALRKNIDEDHTFLSAMYFYGLGRGTLTQMPLSAVAQSVLDAGPMQNRDGFQRQCDVLLTTDTVDRLPQISAPTLVLHSPDDKFFTKEQSETIAAALSGSKILEISGTGHCPMIENPPAFLEAVTDFVTSKAA